MVRKRPRVEPTNDFQQILPLCWWPEQVEYERMRQPVLFGSSIAERARETGVSESTLTAVCIRVDPRASLRA